MAEEKFSSALSHLTGSVKAKFWLNVTRVLIVYLEWCSVSDREQFLIEEMVRALEEVVAFFKSHDRKSHVNSPSLFANAQFYLAMAKCIKLTSTHKSDVSVARVWKATWEQVKALFSSALALEPSLYKKLLAELECWIGECQESFQYNEKHTRVGRKGYLSAHAARLFLSIPFQELAEREKLFFLMLKMVASYKDLVLRRTIYPIAVERFNWFLRAHPSSAVAILDAMEEALRSMESSTDVEFRAHSSFWWKRALCIVVHLNIDKSLFPRACSMLGRLHLILGNSMKSNLFRLVTRILAGETVDGAEEAAIICTHVLENSDSVDRKRCLRAIHSVVHYLESQLVQNHATVTLLTSLVRNIAKNGSSGAVFTGIVEDFGNISAELRYTTCKPILSALESEEIREFSSLVNLVTTRFGSEFLAPKAQGEHDKFFFKKMASDYLSNSN